MKGDLIMGLLMTIDNGGTFTDACLISKDEVISAKTITTPYDLSKCFIDVIKEISKKYYGEENINALLTDIDYLRYSTTAGTNAIIENIGSRVGLILSEDFDVSVLQETKEQKDMFDSIVKDRVAFINLKKSEEELELHVVELVNQLISQGADRIVISLNEPNLIDNEIKLKNIILRKYPRHLLGAVPILISHELSDDKDDSRRTWGSLINSYLHSGMERFLYNAENILRNHRAKKPLLIFQNDGNSVRVSKSTAIKSYSSGPRGGMEGALALAEHYQLPSVITLDVGGTTSDVGLVNNNTVKEEMFGRIENIPTPFSLSELTSIGIGGSSIFKVDNGEIKVGPKSVGAAPGPACFGRGGEEATITDVYLVMGVLDSRSYLRGTLDLDEERAKTAIKKNVAEPLGVDIEKALQMMEKAYVDKITKGISESKNQLDDVTLLAFGGAGPMTACSVAEEAKINNVIVPRLAAIFSAFGISFSDIAHEYQAYVTELNEASIFKKIEELKKDAERDMFAEGYDLSECNIYTTLNYSINEEYSSVPIKESVPLNEIKNADEVRVHLTIERPIEHFTLNKEKSVKEIAPTGTSYRDIIQKGGKDVPIFQFTDMKPGTTGIGPALIEDEYFTTRILEGWNFKINYNKDILLSTEGSN